MSKKTNWQRMEATRQPYTRIEPRTVPSVQATPQGPVALAVRVFHLYGYTFEGRLTDPEAGTWSFVKEEHDLGQVATLKIADEVAREWRNDLVGVYPVT